MTKEQIDKHGPVIIWFATGDNADKGVWKLPYKNGKWVLCKSPEFHDHFAYVQNDEYSDYHMAQVDGKVIQYKDTFSLTKEGHKWYDMPEYMCFQKSYKYSIEEIYRIKPEESKFKVGDWVSSWEHYKPNVYIQVTKQNIDKLPSSVTLWQPQIGEWCAFWERDAKHYIVDKLDKIETYSSDGTSTKYTKHWATYCGYWFHNIAPLEFIQTLKDS